MIITIDDLTRDVLAELAPWDATYDIEGIVAELADSYPDTVLDDIPEAERLDIYRTYDRAVI